MGLELFLSRMMAFMLSVPINLIIIGVICLLLKFIGKLTVKDILKAFVGYFLICFIFALFGLTLPSIPAIANYIKELVIAFWQWVR